MNHEHPCRYCGEDMRLMGSDLDHELKCSARPVYFTCHVRGCKKHEQSDLRRFVGGVWRQCCKQHFDKIGKKQLRAAGLL